MGRRLGIIVLSLYFIVQFFASLPAEFMGSRAQAVHKYLLSLTTQLGLSPGLAVFGGNLPSAPPHHICVIVAGESAQGAEILYTSDLCNPPYVRLVENSFDAYMGYNLVLSQWDDVTHRQFNPRFALSMGRMFCESSLFAPGRSQAIHFGLRFSTRDYATGALTENLVWPFNYQCLSEVIGIDVSDAVVKAAKKHLVGTGGAHDYLR